MDEIGQSGRRRSLVALSHQPQLVNLGLEHQILKLARVEPRFAGLVFKGVTSNVTYAPPETVPAVA